GYAPTPATHHLTRSGMISSMKGACGMMRQDAHTPEQQSQESRAHTEHTEHTEHSDNAGADTPQVTRPVPMRLAAALRTSRLAAGLRTSRLARSCRTVTQTLPARRRLIAIAAVVGVVILIIWGRSLLVSTPQQIAPDTRLFSVTSRPTLVFAHFIGNVHIMPGPDNQVRIKEKANGQTDAIQIRYTQQGDAILVTVDIPSGLLVDTWVDFDVNVPASAGLTARMATGTLEATDLRGGVALSDTNGSIWATQVSGPISVKTQSGSINLKQVTGQVTAVTQNGTITTTATQLSDHSMMQAANGTINFHGTLSHNGRCQFLNSDGAVGLVLPSNSDFVLKAHTTTGSIHTDFPGVTLYQGDSGSEARGRVGSAPQAQL